MVVEAFGRLAADLNRMACLEQAREEGQDDVGGGV
jgi:hypothetical protein